MWILQTNETVLVGDEVELAIQLFELLELPLSLERFRHLAVAMTGCAIGDVMIDSLQ